jgi:hypothetical protein
MHGKPARAVLEVTASEVFFHCGKSLIRSRIWEPSHWPDRTGLASLGAVLADQIKPKPPNQFSQETRSPGRKRLTFSPKASAGRD